MRTILTIFFLFLIFIATLGSYEPSEVTKTYIMKNNPSSQTVVTYEGKNVKKILIDLFDNLIFKNINTTN